MLKLIDIHKTFNPGTINEKVALNGVDLHLNEGDLISVRGLGRIAYAGILSETKKGRYMISLRKYI